MFVAEELFVGNQYAINKLKKAMRTLKEAYYASSDFNKLVNVDNARNEETGFQQLGFRHLIPREWFTREDVAIDVAFEQFGANLALSETHHVIDKIFGETSIPKIDLGQNVREGVVTNVEAFSETKQINAMLAPIDHYVDMHMKWPVESQGKIRMDIRTGVLSFCEIQPDIFWSNKYMPFDDFALIDRGFGNWVSKPDFDDRLTVQITGSTEEDKLDLLFFVTMKFNIVEAERVLILRTPKPYLIV
jgi:hypothetical protein